MEFKDVINGRRAVNFFDTAKDVSEEQLREMIELAAKAPSSFNLQPWSVVVLRDRTERETLRKLAWDQPKVSEAPVALIVLADRSAWQAGHAVVEKNFQEMVAAGTMQPNQRQWFLDACKSLYGASDERQQAFAVKNAGFFAMALMLAAKNLGLETHPMDGFDHEGVKKAFNIPDSYWIPLLLSVGYFRGTETLQPAKWRKRYDEIVVKYH